MYRVMRVEVWDEYGQARCRSSYHDGRYDTPEMAREAVVRLREKGSAFVRGAPPGRAAALYIQGPNEMEFLADLAPVGQRKVVAAR